MQTSRIHRYVSFKGVFFYVGSSCDTFFKTNKISKPLWCLESAEVTLQFLWNWLTKFCSLQRERMFIIPPVRLFGFYHFLCNWPVLQDKLERKLEADELCVSHLGHWEAKNDTSNKSLRPSSRCTLTSPLKIKMEKNIYQRKKTV